MNENEFALGIEVEILFVRNEQKDCNVKPDPQGNAQKPIKMVEKRLERGINQIAFGKGQHAVRILYGNSNNFKTKSTSSGQAREV